MLNKKHNLKSANSKYKKKGVETKNKTGNQKRENIDEETFCNWIFDVVPFMKQERRRKKSKERDKNKDQKKAKKKDKKEGKRRRTTERQRKRNWKRGRPKKAKEKQRETLKNKQKMPFSRGKKVFCIKEAKKGINETKTKNHK